MDSTSIISSTPLKKYAPQLQIIQCYKCGDYGHRAAQCKQKQSRCRKCGESHSTNECKSTELKCAHCNGKHEIWHHECPTWIAESRRLSELKRQTSPYFTS